VKVNHSRHGRACPGHPRLGRGKDVDARVKPAHDGVKSGAISGLIVALALSSLAFAAPSHAQEQQSFKTIISKGYDIKSVTFARGESTDNREIFVVTMQKEKSVAVCYFAAANWINLSSATLEDSKRCDVRY